MREFTVFISNYCDIPAVLSEALANIGSLQASREQWASLLNAMGVDLWYKYHEDAPKKSVREAAEAILCTAVPEEGERGIVTGEGLREIHFKTPGNVEVSILGNPTNTHIGLSFNRDSTYLATLILADMFRRVPAAAPLLAQVAAEAAAKYEATLASA